MISLMSSAEKPPSTSAARDEILPVRVEGGLVGVGAVDPGIAQDLAPGIGAAPIAFLVIHGRLLSRRQRAVRKPSTAVVYASGCSTLDMCAASSTSSLAPGMLFLRYSFASSGVAGSCRPAITSVGTLIFGNSARWSMSRTASPQAM